MKTSRIPQLAMDRFGLFAIIESKRVVLPLKGVECDFSVVSGIVEVSMTQIFRQENKKPFDCEYLFPLPADASVFSCEADINGRTIRAQVREREEARHIAAEKKAAGFRTALVESERDNLFTLSLGNVQPNDLIVVQVKYFQTLRSFGEERSVEIPLCPGIRYIPGNPLLRSNKGKGVIDDTNQVPDASRITPVRIDREHPDAAYIEVRGTLDGKFAIENTLSSPSHRIVVNRTGKELRIALSDKGDVPDRDFVLRWSERNADVVTSRVWIREKGDEAYALLEVRAPKTVSSQRAAVDFYFLVDRSGSMAGEKWNQAAAALKSCVRVLSPSDRAMITFFESQFVDFAERPLPVQELLDDRSFHSLKKLGTAGGTEMMPALKHVLEIAAKHSPGRDKNLILITDAQIGNESAILELMKTTPDLPVHCFGIDIALNDSLLLALCRQQGGTFHSMNPSDDIQQAVARLGKTLAQPVLLDLHLAEGWELADAKIPNLYAGQIHYLSARSTGRKEIEVIARSASSEPLRIQFEKQPSAAEAPYLHWCRSRIQRLIAQGDEKSAIALSTQSNLICPLTAFIAWDESEQVAVADHHLVQPVAKLCEAHEMSFPQIDHSRARRRPAAAPAASAKAGLVPSPPAAGGGWFRRLFTGDADAAMPLHESISVDELNLKRELSNLCHRIGVPDWQSMLKAIFDWIAEANATERSIRIKLLRQLIGEIKAVALNINALATVQEQLQAEETRQTKIQQLLKSFVETLPAKN